MTLGKGDEIKFRNGDKTLTGWVDSDEPVCDASGTVLGYVVASPEFQGIVAASNIINQENN